ncbi:hypothetical protein [Amycolatopsis sp. NBC_01286]|uniref:hypothetical protein n=1 Tax=Amycolatopsis sp. NBC_01286 TaxID=2903560 RepID=UPI002E12AA0C|nr:hypothetical protein OG570_48245 [Amycolatopsis sp. NBC_01286]
MTATIPGEQQLTFEAKDATEFRALLGRIIKESPLSCSQVAIKTGMPRSTAYSLPNIKRPGLPSNPAQVTDFVRACGLSATQTALVMDLWEKLRREAENARTASENAKSRSASAAIEMSCEDLSDVVLALKAAGIEGVPHTGEVMQPDLRAYNGTRRSVGWAGIGGKPPFRRDTSWTELLQYVLGNEERTRRAVSLLRVVLLLVLVIVVALVFLAIQQPVMTPVIVSGLIGPFVLLMRQSMRKRPPKTKN